MAMSAVGWRPRGEDLLVALATGLFAAGLCGVPPTLFESGDYVLYWKPTFQFLSDAVCSGVVPLWNPYIGLGRPFLADMQNVVFYPPAYLICAGQLVGVFLSVWAHCLLAILGMRRLGSALGVGRWQSYFMGFTYLASGALTARWMTGQITYCWGLCFVPWLLYHALRTEDSWQTRRLAQYAGCLALQFLCGHPQVFWFSAVGQAAFIFTRSLRLPVRQAIRDAAQGLGQFGVACVGCAGLVAVVLLPMFELIKESNRSETTAVFATSYNLSWKSLLSLFGPLQDGAIWEANLFVGTVVVASGIMGLSMVRERNVRGLLGVLLAALLIALGDKTPLFGLFYKWLPGYAGFRFHARAALLVVMALICGAGIWFSRPHPRLRAVWTYLCGGIPVHYAFIFVVVLQSLDLLQGAWMIKRVITLTCSLNLGTPAENSAERRLVSELQKAGLSKALLPPPRVCVPPSSIPINYGMIHRYSHFDAACSLFVRRPWDWLHAILRLPPPIEKASLSPKVYARAPFPYRSLSLSIGMEPESGRFVVAPAPAPRAYVVYGAQVADYGQVLERIRRSHDMSLCALLEKPLAEPLPPTNTSPATAATIFRFEPNELLVDAPASTNGLLVLAEAWYPGWRAEVDGRPVACVPANIWMRAVPVPAGRHQVRVYFRQNKLLPGLLVSLASGVLLLAAAAKRSQPVAPPTHEWDVPNLPAAPPADKHRAPKQPSRPFARQPRPAPSYRPWLRALAAAMVLALAWLAARMEIRQVRLSRSRDANVNATVHCQVAEALVRQQQTAQAAARYAEGLRLARLACELTGYDEPVPLGTLAIACAGSGQKDQAVAFAERGRVIALATGQDQLAETLQKLVEQCRSRTQPRPAGRN
jgi:hypothetical protein